MSTNTRGTKFTSIVKHPFAKSGRVYSDKRKHSEEEEEERKRDRKNSTDCPETDQVEKEDLIFFDSTPNIQEEMTGEDMKRALIEALKDRDVAEVLTETFDKSARKIVETLEARVEQIEAKDVERDTDMADIKLRLDMMETKDRDKNIIVTGLPSDCKKKDEVTKALNGLLGTRIYPDDLEQTYKLVKKGTDANAATRTRVIFKDKAMKSTVVKAKTKLKGKNIWVSDDLTAYRSNMAYQARQAVRNQIYEQTWVHDGKIFVKRTGQIRPTKMTSPGDLIG